jgi:hypothetical protein
MPDRSSKRPRDANQRAKLVVEIATGEATEPTPGPEPEKNPAAVELGRKGGLQGGKARAEKLSAAERSEIAQKAAATRWQREKDSRKAV